MPPSLFELRRAREEKAAPQRSDGGTKEERDDRPMLAIAERRARPKAERFYRPSCGTAVSFLHHFPALRTGLPDTPYLAVDSPQSRR
jgi:hypothetical protein